MWKSTVRIAKELGVSRQTVFRWARDGKYEKVERTKGGHYRVWCEPEESAVVGYCRASSKKQSSSLKTQEDLIREAYPEVEIIQDIGSGFNFKRKGLQALLERCVRGSAITVVVTTRDRLCRASFPLLQWVIELHGGTVVTLEEDGETERFDVQTLLAFLTSFCASHHGKRSHRKRKNSDLSEE